MARISRVRQTLQHALSITTDSSERIKRQGATSQERGRSYHGPKGKIRETSDRSRTGAPVRAKRRHRRGYVRESAGSNGDRAVRGRNLWLGCEDYSPFRSL